ncbi:hypothetical protein RZS08_19385, partial [Arthrospira platensis SPKY1]|nr:hypothetical protein [Arthrospira platensis SPKY1]
MQLLQPGQDLGLAVGIQRGQRFVHQQQARAGGQSACNGHALALAPGQLVRVAGQKLADAQQIQAMAPIVATLPCGRAVITEAQVALDREVPEQA